MAHYNASKGGIVALVKSRALDLGPWRARQRRRSGMIRTRANYITEDPVAGPEYLKECRSVALQEPSEMAAGVVASFRLRRRFLRRRAAPGGGRRHDHRRPPALAGRSSRARCALKPPNPPYEEPIMKSAVIEDADHRVQRAV